MALVDISMTGTTLGAGPHDLGPGDNTRDTFPELMAQSDAKLTISDSGDYRGEWTPMADDTDLQQDIVICNMPYVWFSSCAVVLLKGS